MARDRRIPAALAVVSRRHGTPLGAGAFLVATSAAALLVSQFWPGLVALPQTPHYVALFAWAAAFGGFALVATYLLLCVGALRGIATARHRVALAAAAAVGIVITAGASYASFFKVTKPTIYAPWVALALLAIGFASTFVVRARQPASTRLAETTPDTRPPPRAP
jgi:amino acid transporter